MSNRIFPTGYGSVSATFTVNGVIYVDDGTQNGFITGANLLTLFGLNLLAAAGGEPVLAAIVNAPLSASNSLAIACTSWVVAGFAPLVDGIIPEEYLPPGATSAPFVGSGTGHAAGLVPDPGATAGTYRFLNENGTFMPVDHPLFIFVPGTLVPNQVLWRLNSPPYPLTIAAEFTGWKFSGVTAATAAMVLTLLQNENPIATISIAVGATVGTITPAGSSAITIATTDDLRLVAPNVPDTTFRG